MKNVPDLLVLVEHVDRELDLLCLVRHRLQAEHGIEMRIANFYLDAPQLVCGPAPRAVLLPFCYARDEMTMRDYAAAWPKTAFFNLAWEQILYPTNQQLKAPRDDFARTQVKHLAWSQDFVDFLVGCGVPREHVTLVGHWLYGIYAPRYRSYFPSREQIAARFGLDANKRWIFVPENYRWAFFAEKKLLKLAEKGVENDELLELRRYCRSGLQRLAQWCDTLARQPGVEVIFRPRPATGTSEMKRFFAKEAGLASPAFRLIKDLSAREWVLASDLVISSYSTVLVEAALAEKEILMAEPEPIPASLRYAWCDLVPSVATQEAFVARCTQAGGEDSGMALREWAQGHFFPCGDPIDKLVKTLAAIVAQTRALTPATQPCDIRLPQWLRAVAPLLPARVKHRLFQRFARGYAFNAGTHEKDFFSDATVHDRTKRWSQAA